MFFELFSAFWVKKKISKISEIFFSCRTNLVQVRPFFGSVFPVFFQLFFNIQFSILNFLWKLFKILEIINSDSKHLFIDEIGQTKWCNQKLEHFRFRWKKKYLKNIWKSRPRLVPQIWLPSCKGREYATPLLDTYEYLWSKILVYSPWTLKKFPPGAGRNPGLPPWTFFLKKNRKGLKSWTFLPKSQRSANFWPEILVYSPLDF